MRSSLVTLDRLLLIVLLACLGGVSNVAIAAELKAGDPAPDLAITKWVKGQPVDLAALKGKKVAVVEFWATWCKPCVASIPHLTELQKKHPNDLVVIGVTKPDRTNPLGKVEKFVADWGKRMEYRVAFDGNGKTYEAFMHASGQGGIPTSFIVNRAGKIAWIGHPLGLDAALKRVLAGSFDAELAGIQMRLRRRVDGRLRRRDGEGALRAVNALVALSPGDPQPVQYRFNIELQLRKFDVAAKTAEELLELGRDEESLLNNLAWQLLTVQGFEGKHTELAMRAAMRCDEITKSGNWMYRDTLALAIFATGDIDGALATQVGAIAMSRKARASERSIQELQARLGRFRGAKAEARAAEARGEKAKAAEVLAAAEKAAATEAAAKKAAAEELAAAKAREKKAAELAEETAAKPEPEKPEAEPKLKNF